MIFTNVSKTEHFLDISFIYKRKNANSSTLFLDSACQELNLKHHCYTFDPHCPPQNDIEKNDITAKIDILVVYLSLAIAFLALFSMRFCRQKLRQLCYGK